MKHPYFWGEIEQGRFFGFSINGQRLYELIDFKHCKKAVKPPYSGSKR